MESGVVSTQNMLTRSATARAAKAAASVAAAAAPATVVAAAPQAAACRVYRQQYVYRLKLAENDAGIRYFIGRTSDSDIDHRLRQHANGVDPIKLLTDSGCESFERLDLLMPVDDQMMCYDMVPETASVLWERETYLNMFKFGVHRVRGWLHRRCYFDEYGWNYAFTHTSRMHNLCLRCGNDDHLTARTCAATHYAAWASGDGEALKPILPIPGEEDMYDYNWYNYESS
jgi:hypothetical protein